MDINVSILKLSQKISDLHALQSKLNEQLSMMDSALDKSLENECALNTALRELAGRIQGQTSTPHVEPQASPAVPEPQVNMQNINPQAVDPTAQMEKLLQGTLDVLGDKISDRLMSMLKELKSLPVEARSTRIKEVKQIADEELLDLSTLYKHQAVESNIEEVGIEEHATKSVDKNLERLRKLRQSQTK